jgi:hypothetical protein
VNVRIIYINMKKRREWKNPLCLKDSDKNLNFLPSLDVLMSMSEISAETKTTIKLNKLKLKML